MWVFGGVLCGCVDVGVWGCSLWVCGGATCLLSLSGILIPSLDFEECAHKVLKMELKPGQEVCGC